MSQSCLSSGLAFFLSLDGAPFGHPVNRLASEVLFVYHMAIWPRPGKVFGFAALTPRTVLVTRTPVDTVTLEGR